MSMVIFMSMEALETVPDCEKVFAVIPNFTIVMVAETTVRKTIM